MNLFHVNIPASPGRILLLNNAAPYPLRAEEVDPPMNRIHQKTMVSLLCSIALVALPVFPPPTKRKSPNAASPIFEAQLPAGSRIALHIRSGAVRIGRAATKES